jgi:hypothetical protein
VDNFLKYAYAGSETSDLFGSLIKQSHILSQDQVTDFISKDDPKDRFNSLADIMGLKNILYIYENFKEVRGEVQSTKINRSTGSANAVKKIQESLKELEERKPEAKSKTAVKDQINFKDSESRIMETKTQGVIQGYNPQIAVDADHGIIVGLQMSNSSSDGFREFSIPAKRIQAVCQKR